MRMIMTIKIPERNMWDRLLNAFGKKRGVIIPTNPCQQFEGDIYTSARKENFWKAVFRPKDKKLPDGMVDISDLNFSRDRDI